MQIGVYGLGYLGTVVSACLADFGMPVTCYDRDSARVATAARGDIPFYEKNLKEVIRRNVRSGRLIYSTDLESFVRKSQVVFLAEDSCASIDEIALRLTRSAPADSILVLMTPAPVGSAAQIEQRVRANTKAVTVVSQPMFLTDGCAVEDFNWPDRIVLGTTSAEAVLRLKQIYRPLVMRGVPVIVTNFETAELVREASTAFVATKISFINELAKLCEHVNGDAVDLALAMGLDKKIAPRCLQPGAGFGGPFTESDLDSLVQLASRSGVPLKILSAAREVNHSFTDSIVDKLSRVLETVSGKELGILGLAFKPNTNSIVGSSSVMLARNLALKGARVRAYDPVAMPFAMAETENAIRYCETPYAAAEGVDALVLATGWPEFRGLDFEKIKRLQRRPLIVDTKNLLDSGRLRSMGFEYVGVGRA